MYIHITLKKYYIPGRVLNACLFYSKVSKKTFFPYVNVFISISYREETISASIANVSLLATK